MKWASTGQGQLQKLAARITGTLEQMHRSNSKCINKCFIQQVGKLDTKVNKGLHKLIKEASLCKDMDNDSFGSKKFCDLQKEMNSIIEEVSSKQSALCEAEMVLKAK
eukprot:9918183-Lingulodinium_polyedra.AAC.1